MLKEIVCDNFKAGNQIISFHPGLNTILGDNVGSNSIGKSTFLLIVDFVFGGNSFLDKATEVFKHCGYIEIRFKYQFEGEEYSFIRKTNEKDTVYICDKNYDIVSKQSLDLFKKFLFDKYNIDLPYITFREIVSTFSRIYDKGSDDEAKPLNITSNESGEIAVTRLLKLFNIYGSLYELEKVKKQNIDREKAFKSSQKFSFIPKMGEREYKSAIKELERLQEDRSKISTQSTIGELDLQTEQLEEVAKLNEEINAYRRQRSKINSSLARLELNRRLSPSIVEADLIELQSYFPNVNLKKIHEVTGFHSQLCKIIATDVEQQIEFNIKLLDEIEEKINELTAQKQLITSTQNPSTIAINRLLNIGREIDKLESRIKTHQDGKHYKEESVSTIGIYKTEKGKSIAEIQHSLNVKIHNINQFICSDKKNVPILTIGDTSYNYSTTDDRGTGTNYKNVVVLDMSILELTELPILIHDSIILKQIADEYIDKIFERYKSYTAKQIFVALDKKESYFSETNKILTDTTVLELFPNGGELFGRSWGEAGS